MYGLHVKASPFPCCLAPRTFFATLALPTAMRSQQNVHFALTPLRRQLCFLCSRLSRSMSVG